MNEKQIKDLFKLRGFNIKAIFVLNQQIELIVYKDYSKGFNIEFDGNVILKIIINKMFFKFPNVYNIKFYEENNLIPKQARNHFYSDGSICYAPPERPIYENWKLLDYIDAVDAMLNDWFNKEYIGASKLRGLEHGDIGKIQYNILKDIIK